MAHFYGTLNGSRGQATRAGNKGSGLTATAASWDGAIQTHVWHDAEKGVNRYRVEQVRWHGSGVNAVIAEGIIGDPLTHDDHVRALELIRDSDGFNGGTAVSELQGIAREALKKEAPNAG